MMPPIVSLQQSDKEALPPLRWRAYNVAMLEIKNLTKQYSRPVLKDVSFRIEKKQICGLFGANGAGKSTLLKIITGLEKATAGEVLWNGEPVTLNNPPIGAMIESPCFLPGLSGFQNLMLLAELSGQATKKDVYDALSTVGIAHAADTPVKRYSLGMKQRLYFAFALMRHPEVIVLDEPFNGIDPIALSLFEGIVKELAARGACILISSHEIRELQALVDKAVFLDHGKMIYENEKAQEIDIFKEFLARVDTSGRSQ